MPIFTPARRWQPPYYGFKREKPSRRMLAATGHPVSRLVRTEVGPIRLGTLKPGASRELTTREIGELYAAVGL